jgi:hypothetical protein
MMSTDQAERVLKALLSGLDNPAPLVARIYFGGEFPGSGYIV